MVMALCSKINTPISSIGTCATTSCACLRLNIASTTNDQNQCLPLMAKGVIENNLIVYKINAIGGLIDD
jgi:hypothetical protein